MIIKFQIVSKASQQRLAKAVSNVPIREVIESCPLNATLVKPATAPIYYTPVVYENIVAPGVDVSEEAFIASCQGYDNYVDEYDEILNAKYSQMNINGGESDDFIPDTDVTN